MSALMRINAAKMIRDSSDSEAPVSSHFQARMAPPTTAAKRPMPAHSKKLSGGPECGAVNSAATINVNMAARTNAERRAAQRIASKRVSDMMISFQAQCTLLPAKIKAS